MEHFGPCEKAYIYSTGKMLHLGKKWNLKFILTLATQQQFSSDKIFVLGSSN